MRKTLLIAGAATIALVTASSAHAQAPTVAPSVTGTASVSPSKAGTKAKPKATKIKLGVKNDQSSKATASGITITFPSTLKLSTSGLTQCTASDTAILTAPTTACKGASAGKGTADALLNPFAPTPGPLHFSVTAFVGKNQLLFYLVAGSVKAVLHGKISGKKLAIGIPTTLQQPVPGAFSALEGLNVTLSAKKGSKALLSSTGCTGGAHKLGVSVSYVPNPSPPLSSTATTTASAKCS